MNKIKIIDAASVVYWATTYQGVFEVDGEAVEFRFHENSNGCEFYVYEEGEGWIEADLEENEAANVVYNMCLDYNLEEWGETGDEFEYDPEEDMI